MNLLGVPLEERPSFFVSLLPRLQELRAKTGRPHWIVVDEAHHLLPASTRSLPALPTALSGFLLITVHPERVDPTILASIDEVAAVGEAPHFTLQVFAEAIGQPASGVAELTLAAGEALLWRRRHGAPVRFRITPPRAERDRHRRKYAQGELGPDKSFYFRGPKGALNLRAQNLVLFLQLADGVDEATWLHHLRRSDYSRWIRASIKDDKLAAEIERIEQADDLTAEQSRGRVRDAIEQRYTAPA